MKAWLTDCERGASIVDTAVPDVREIPTTLDCPYAPCTAGGLMLCACRKENDCAVFSRRTKEELYRIPALPALTAMTVSPCMRYLYQLSAEADCVHTRHLGTGDLLFSAKTGVFPRDMKTDSGGRMLLVAGGASGEAYLLHAPELTLYSLIRVKGCCCSVERWQEGLVFLCAVEKGDIQTAIYTLAPSKVRPVELLRLDGQPGALCVGADGLSAFVGTLAGLMKICLKTGKILWNLPYVALCTCLIRQNGLLLASGCLGGSVYLLSDERPWLCRKLYSGQDPQAAFL